MNDVFLLQIHQSSEDLIEIERKERSRGDFEVDEVSESVGVLLGDDVEISVVVVDCEVVIDHFEYVGVGNVFQHGEFSVFVVFDWYFFDCESVLCGGVCFVDYAECSLCYNAFQNILS